MHVALYDVDSKIPNLALMRLSTYHKQLGDTVEMYQPLRRDEFDRIYAATIFDDSDKSLLDDERMIIGGTGYNLTTTLPPEVERLVPDYSIYPHPDEPTNPAKHFPHSIGFAMRGCRFRCKFCVVPAKEGRPKSNNTIAEVWTQRDSNHVVLLDNDFFGNSEWRERIAEIHDLGVTVNFNQGLNIRIITDEQATALASVKFYDYKRKTRRVHFAWDRFNDERLIDAGIERVVAAGIKHRQMTFYVLIGFDTTPEQDLYRVNKLAALGCDPYVMPYDKSVEYQRRFARWVNHKAIFKSVAWSEYGRAKFDHDEAQADLFEVSR